MVLCNICGKNMPVENFKFFRYVCIKCWDSLKVIDSTGEQVPKDLIV